MNIKETADTYQRNFSHGAVAKLDENIELATNMGMVAYVRDLKKVREEIERREERVLGDGRAA